MSDDLNRAEQLLMWELFLNGGERLLKDIVPKPKVHTALAKRKLVSIVPKGRTRLLTLEDRGWRWIKESDPFALSPGETRVTAERRLLQGFARAVKAYAAANGLELYKLFGQAPTVLGNGQAPAAPEFRAPEPLSARVRAVFFALAGRPPREGVRLSELRAALADIAAPQLDEALREMREARQAKLLNLDNPYDIKQEEGAALHIGRQVFHVLWIDS